MGFEELYVEGTDLANNIVNGLALLKNYSTLKVHLNAIQSKPRVLGSLVLEMMLLIDGFLADGEIFKSYGYEDLYENGFLTYDHWKEFQQAQLEKDISALERSYNEIDHNLDCGEESRMPLSSLADLLYQDPDWIRLRQRCDEMLERQNERDRQNERNLQSFIDSTIIRFSPTPALQEALAAQKFGFGNTCPLQYYIERRQRLQVLHEKFGEQNLKLKMATAQSATSFRNLGDTLKDHRKAWAYGITTLRRLCQGKERHDLAHTVAFLCLAKAISEAIDKNDTCENSTDFFQDLDRWQILFKADAASLDAYKEAVRLMWGIELNQRVKSSEKACQLETLVYFQTLASALVNQTRELLTYPCNPNRKGLESSQECWRWRFSEESSTSETKYGIFGSQSSRRTSTRVFGAKDPKPPDSQYPDRTFSDPQPPDSQPPDSQPPDPRLPDPQFPDPQSPQKESILRERVNRDIFSAGICPVVAVLMAGAIFAILFLFLKCSSSNLNLIGIY